MPIPGTRSYFDPITQREEIWLEEGATKAERAWLRCKTEGPIEEEQKLIPVEVERCLEKIQRGLSGALRSLFKSEELPSNSYYIPTADGDLGMQYATRDGQGKSNAFLILGNNASTADMEIIGRYGTVELAKLLNDPGGVSSIREANLNKPEHAETMLNQNKRNVFPTERISEVSITKPAHHERWYYRMHNGQREVVREKETIDTTPSGPLTHSMRQLLLKNASIVYEVVPNDADRLLICMKHVHGQDGDQIGLGLLRGEKSACFCSHQQGLMSLYEDLLRKTDMNKVKFYNESFVSSFSDSPVKIQNILRYVIQGSLQMHGEDIQKKLCNQLAHSSGVRTALIGLTLFGYNAPNEAILRYCGINNRLELLFGDGRLDTPNEMPQFVMKRGESESDTEWENRCSEKTFESHAPLTKQIATSLQSGDIGFLLYGGVHFGSGRMEEENINRPHLETYFRSLSQTQIIVIEEKHYPEVRDLYESIAPQELLMLKLINIHCQKIRSTFLSYINLKGGPPQNSEAWNATCNQLKEFNDLLEEFLTIRQNLSSPCEKVPMSFGDRGN